MYNHKMYEKGIKSSAIRELFEYGKLKKQELGEDKVFDFSIGNPNVKPPKCVNDSLIKLLENDAKEMEDRNNHIDTKRINTNLDIGWFDSYYK